jgi:hypothetical protein
MFPIPTPTPASAIVAMAAPISLAATTIISNNIDFRFKTNNKINKSTLNKKF